MAVDLQKAKNTLQKEFEELQKSQKAIQKCVETRQKLEAQLTENKVVKEELEFLEVSFCLQFVILNFIIFAWLEITLYFTAPAWRLNSKMFNYWFGS